MDTWMAHGDFVETRTRGRLIRHTKEAMERRPLAQQTSRAETPPFQSAPTGASVGLRWIRSTVAAGAGSPLTRIPLAVPLQVGDIRRGAEVMNDRRCGDT
jgi:hypothetical protein